MSTISYKKLRVKLKKVYKFFRKNSVRQQKVSRRGHSSFHNQTRLIFSIASLCGIFPIQNIHKKNVFQIKARLFSISYFYSCFMLAGFITMSIYGVVHIIYHTTFQIDKIKESTAPFIFYSYCTTACYLFIDTAKKWPKIIRLWSKIEKDVRYIKPPTTSTTLATFLLVLGLGEHLFHNWISTKDGDRLDEGSLSNYLKKFCFSSHRFLVNEWSYSLWKGLLVVFFSFCGTFLWNFSDIFNILVTNGLRSQLNAWNEFSYHRLLMADVCWRTYRSDYLKIINFVKLVDQFINKLIGLSLITNFYFISAQLVEQIRIPHDKYSERMFFLFSFSFIVLRTVASFLSSASVYDEWKRVSTPIHACWAHSVEVERLLVEIHSDFVGMTAFNMFHITRGLILAMFGAVLSYELLFVETHEAEKIAAALKTVSFEAANYTYLNG